MSKSSSPSRSGSHVQVIPPQFFQAPDNYSEEFFWLYHMPSNTSANNKTTVHVNHITLAPISEEE